MSRAQRHQLPALVRDVRREARACGLPRVDATERRIRECERQVASREWRELRRYADGLRRANEGGVL